MSEFKSQIDKLYNTVIEGGYCIGCGACAVDEGSPIKVKFDKYKKLQATVSLKDLGANHNQNVLSVCPFSNESLDEDVIGRELYREDLIKNEKLGFVEDIFAGYVKEKNYRENGSSGGMGSWILAELLKEKLIDGVIHVKESDNNNGRMFEYAISKRLSEITHGAKSRYYPVEMSKVLRTVKSISGKYAIVGLPCFIKAIRLLSKEDQILSDRLKFSISLVCGHLKSAHFASMWGWQVGIHPDDLVTINFREKLPGKKAINYGIKAMGKTNGEFVKKISKPLDQLYGKNWGWGYFKYEACDYCDDVVGETADLTIGDAWLPKYINDDKGTNLIITRNRILSNILKEANEQGKIKIDRISSTDAIRSQDASFRHRREGLAYRLHLKDIENHWRPRKRVQANKNGVSNNVKKIQFLRIQMARKSHIAFLKALDKNSFDIFIQEMKPLSEKYKKLYRKSLIRRILDKVLKLLSEIL